MEILEEAWEKLACLDDKETCEKKMSQEYHQISRKNSYPFEHWQELGPWRNPLEYPCTSDGERKADHLSARQALHAWGVSEENQLVMKKCW
jgi:hypothetical protein